MQISTLFLVGEFAVSLDIDPGTSIVTLTSVGFRDGFVVKLNSDGNYMWGFGILGDEDFDRVTDVEVDAMNNVYISGFYRGTVDLIRALIPMPIHQPVLIQNRLWQNIRLQEITYGQRVLAPVRMVEAH